MMNAQLSWLWQMADWLANHPLTRDSQMRAWSRVASWQVRSRLQDEIVVPWIEGQRILARRGMTGATGNIYSGLHEFADMMLVLHFLRPEDLFFDVGANIGIYTILASGVCGARTSAFEPDEDTARWLQRNIELNGLEGRAAVHEMAAGDADGALPFTRGRDTTNRVASENDLDVRSVRAAKLDSLARECPAMIKIDVEGYEGAVLRGAKRLLGDETLAVIELETWAGEAEDVLHAHGFSRAHYDPFSRALTAEPSRFPSSNAVFVRRRDFVAERLRTARRVRVFDKLI